MARDGQDRRRTALVEELRRAGGKALSVRELMQRAKLHQGERTDVKRALRDLTRDGVLLRDGKRFSLPAARPAGAPAAGLAAPGARQGLRRPGRGNEVVGTLKKHRDGFGFVARLDRKGDDVFLPPDEAAKALDGDFVRIEIVPARGGRTAGRLVEVVERRRRLLIGTYHARGARSFVVPADEALVEVVPVPETSAAQDGDVVKVALEPGTARLQGAMVEAIGRPGEPRVEVLKVAYAKGFADVFPDPVRAEAEATPDHVRAEDREGRRDLTALPLVTIDGEDARDFDDAVYVERLEASEGEGALPARGRDRRRRALRPAGRARSTRRRRGAGRASTSRCRCCRCCRSGSRTASARSTPRSTGSAWSRTWWSTSRARPARPRCTRA